MNDLINYSQHIDFRSAPCFAGYAMNILDFLSNVFQWKGLSHNALSTTHT